jgi:hypothetical protein
MCHRIPSYSQQRTPFDCVQHSFDFWQIIGFKCAVFIMHLFKDFLLKQIRYIFSDLFLVFSSTSASICINYTLVRRKAMPVSTSTADTGTSKELSVHSLSLKGWLLNMNAYK